MAINITNIFIRLKNTPNKKGNILKLFFTGSNLQVLIETLNKQLHYSVPSKHNGVSLKFQEEELRNSGDPKFSHLSDELHVEVTAFAPPAEAHARIAYALAEVRRFLVPVRCVGTVTNLNSNLISLVGLQCLRNFTLFEALPDHLPLDHSRFSPV